jgi:transcriptional regulator with PAS, ATPase and Fis domain
LRVLQERHYYPVGDINLQKFSASVISASNLTLEETIKRHQFREDLRYHLEVIPLRVPPLRDRRDDIILLFRHFLEQASSTDNWETNSALESKLINHHWPGKEEREVFEYRVKMEIIPYIIDNQTVTLNIIDASVSDVVMGGDGYLQLIKHKVSNQVSVKNREFIFLGGMMQQSAIKNTEGLPKLKKLPFLGWLFGQEKKRNSDYEVWIMIRPSILYNFSLYCSMIKF